MRVVDNSCKVSGVACILKGEINAGKVVEVTENQPVTKVNPCTSVATRADDRTPIMVKAVSAQAVRL